MASHTTQKTLGAALAAAALAIGWALPAWAEDAATTRAWQALEQFTKADPTLSGKLWQIAGYAILPSVGKGGLGLGGASGTGVMFEKGQITGRVSMTQVSVGAQAGAQKFSELILFETDHALADFKRGNFAFAGQLSAVAATAGASTQSPYENGVKVLTLAERGLMLEASVGGQQFHFTPAPPVKAPLAAATPAKEPAAPQQQAEPTPAAKLTEPAEAPTASCEAGTRELLSRSTIHFDFDSSALKDPSRASLETVADAMTKCPSAHLLIAGNCDERGTAEYNLALGHRRADAAKAFLTGLGVPASRIDTVSYGFDRPVDPGHDEAAWTKNRRADFSLTTPSVSLAAPKPGPTASSFAAR
jgi:peptidoglycan-associated lipoprotein